LFTFVELCNLEPSGNTVGLITLRSIWWSGKWRKINEDTLWLAHLKETTTSRPWCRGKGYNKMDVRKAVTEEVLWTDLAHDSVPWTWRWTLGFHNMVFLDQWNDWWNILYRGMVSSHISSAIGSN
jgi:hypothetical protein